MKSSKSLRESLMLQTTIAAPAPELMIENLCAEWGETPCCELSVLLSMLRFTFLSHHTHHLISKGDAFYGDHLLFQRLYEETLEQIDVVAEKVLGLSGTEFSVDLSLQIKQIARLSQHHVSIRQTIPQSDQLARHSLAIAKHLVSSIDILKNRMQERSCLTNGVDNMLQGIADTVESHIYLLGRRCLK